eukprot:15366169-Ditylum_brightwellii.AAC.1
MSQLGYTSCLADRDVWFKAMTRPEDRFNKALQEIDNLLIIKRELIWDPSMYLDTKVCKITLDNGFECWGLSPSKYVQKALRNVEKHLHKTYNTSLPKNVKTPYPKDYKPELGLSPELGPSEANYYYSCNGLLR